MGMDYGMLPCSIVLGHCWGAALEAWDTVVVQGWAGIIEFTPVQTSVNTSVGAVNAFFHTDGYHIHC